MFFFFFVRMRRPPRAPQSRSSAASDVYKRQGKAVHGENQKRRIVEIRLSDGSCSDSGGVNSQTVCRYAVWHPSVGAAVTDCIADAVYNLSLIHISEPTRLGMISYAVFCLKKKKKKNKQTRQLRHQKTRMVILTEVEYDQVMLRETLRCG